MSKLYRAKCAKCGSQHAFQGQALEAVREKLCERCHCKLVVTGAEGEDDPQPFPDRERTLITAKETEVARRLVESVIGG